MKTLKKLFTILAIILVAVMAFAPAKSLAVDEITLTITAPDETVDVTAKTIAVYKLFNLTTTVDESGNKTYHYSWDGIGATEEFFKSKDYSTVIAATEYIRQLGETNKTALTALAEEYYNFCKDRTDAVRITKGADEEKVFNQIEVYDSDKQEWEKVNLNAGYYLVYDIKASTDDKTARSVAILSNLEQSETIPLKIETVEVDKTVSETSANVGDTVDFSIKSKVPDRTGYTTYDFIVEDTLSEGLTLLDEITDDKTVGTTVVVKVAGNTKTENVDYTKEITTVNGKTTLKIKFISSKFLELEENDVIEITYSARLNDKAAEAVENSNEVKITYSNDPTNSSSTTTTPPDIVKVYTYTVDLTKKNVGGDTLSGAKFVLQDANGHYIVFTQNTEGIYVYSKTDETITKVTDGIKLVTDENGKLVISGLKAGSYKLIETDAPSDEYAVPNFSFDFTIAETKVPVKEGATELKVIDSTFTYTPTVDAAKGYITVTGGNTGENEIPVLDDDFQITVLNARKSELPTTGGMGTTIFTIVGIVVMVAAVVALVAHNRKND